MSELRAASEGSSLPADWQMVKLGQVLQRARKPVDVEADKTYHEIGIRSHGKGIFYKEPTTGTTLGEKAVFWVQPDCFIVNIVFAWEQAVAKTTTNEVGMIASHRFPMYKPKDGALDLDYVLRFFKTPQGKYLLGLASPGGAGRNKTLGQEAFLDLSIPLPPYPQQRKITTILRTWDDAIALTERRIAAGQRRKLGLMQRLLTGQVRFREFMGQPLRAVELEKVLEIQYGKSPNGVRDESGPYLIYGTGGIVGKSNVALCDNAAVIIGRKGSIDQPQLALEPFWAIDTTYFGLPKDDVNIRWAYYALSHIGLGQYNEASGVPSLSRNTLYTIRVLLPQAKEQHRIAEVLAACDHELDLLARKRDALQRQKRGLMQQLLTGRVRVKV
jgi:type I restriction enzyme, S subunit